MAEPTTGDSAPDYDAALPGAPTELAPSADETSAHTAWALDDGPEWRPPFWTPGRITAAAVVTAVVATVVVAGLAGYHLRPAPESTIAVATTTAVVQLPTTTASAVPTTTERPPPPPPPPPAETVTITRETVTQQAVAPVARFPTPAEIAALDQQLLANLRRQGWAIFNAQTTAERAHQVCDALGDGNSPAWVMDQLLQGGEHAPGDAQTFVATVMATYPYCP
ncbi:DUF732 domain-containing protein [Mycolicibacterium frederiksbergense]|uniref:DUF732 domain-containing protein n=1 Tax=Mycolicibacterium frederiksbergense TaxID=117567 RepID=UPI00265C4170|nr:DUF732 domain-containing protein [Mycolicibacterium frederiksbergense]MBX9919278.1 DUF732 domain-containing protein [Mycolicibacterium frederiksbergense]MDO0975996.1 DUF732 domain-containing protein [Mycolicibacterium frederiksbergense]